MDGVGYGPPTVYSPLLALHALPSDVGILDAGVGTGIFDELLAIVGHHAIEGIGISQNIGTRLQEKVFLPI